MKCRYIVKLKCGKIIVDGEGNISRYKAMVNACNGKITSSAHAGTMKVILNLAMGNEPEAILLGDEMSKEQVVELERLSHKKNGRPSANSTKFYLERLEQLGINENDLTEGTDIFMSNLLKHGDNSSTSRTDYKKLDKYPKTKHQVEMILGIKL